MIARRTMLRALAAATLALGAVLAVPAFLAAQSPAVAKERAAATVVLVIRHAEKLGDPGAMTADPALSPEGVERAAALAQALKGKPLHAVYSTQYLRTRETGRPAAEGAGVPVTVRPVHGGNMASYHTELAAHILAQHRGQTVLVVGHSNTVPAIVKAVSGRDVPPIPESQYGDFYTITIPAGATPSAEQPAALVVSRIGK